jgi:MFS family permease
MQLRRLRGRSPRSLNAAPPSRRLRRPRGDLWRHDDFLRLWAAQTVSQFGSQISLLALPLVAIVALNASTFEVAALGAMEFLPFLLFALPAGVWVDRLPRRPILVIADFGRAVALLSVPLAAGFDVLTIWQLFGVGFATGVLTVFFDVAYQSYLPSLVERDQLVDGNAKLEVSRSAAQVGGPGIAGVLVDAITAPYAILADAVSFLWSALLVFRIRRPEPKPERDAASSMRTELAEGLRYIVRDPRWRAISTYVASSNFCASIAFSVFLLYAVRQLGLSPLAIGIVLGLGNLGWLGGALVAGRVSRRLGPGPTTIIAAMASGPPLLLIPAAPQSFPIPFLILSELIVGACIVLYNVNAISLMQALTPHRLLGRMNASRRFIVWGTIPLGSFAGGGLGTAIGLRPTLWVGAIASCFCFLPMVFSPLRTIRELPEADTVAVEPDDRRLPLETQVADA